MKNLRLLLFVALFIGVNSLAEACRFTVREIAYSILSQTKFSLVIIDGNQSVNHPVIRELSACERQANLNTVVLSETTDSAHPFVQLAKEKRMNFPAYFILAPNNEVLVLKEGASMSPSELKEVFYGKVLDSPIRNEFLADCHASFARVVLLESADEAKNQRASEMILNDCEQIRNLIPMMPKEIRMAPSMLTLSLEQAKKEKIFLWSLGQDSVANEPRALVLYGRARLMGQPLSYQQLLEGVTYKYLSLIGADCECGLDRKWMLGRQALLKWTTESSQQLATELGFDVDSPSILAEMSRILAKEVDEENVNSISFGPENIDVDKVLGMNKDSFNEEEVEEESSFLKVLFATLSAFFLISILLSIWYWKRSK